MPKEDKYHKNAAETVELAHLAASMKSGPQTIEELVLLARFCVAQTRVCRELKIADEIKRAIRP
jgi:hypothetical protein